jgi:hypothetical protein
MNSHDLYDDSLTADEWLELAIDAEDHAKACGAFDPAFEHFCVLKQQYLMKAIAVERRSLLRGG